MDKYLKVVVNDGINPIFYAVLKKEMNCGNCQFYCFEKLQCHKNPPTIDGWPIIAGDDWCGEHKWSDKMVKIWTEETTIAESEKLKKSKPL